MHACRSTLEDPTAGEALAAEIHLPTNALTRRFAHGPGVDEPLVWYEGAGLSDRRWLHADERGSIIAVSSDAGAITQINRYDDYGMPQGGTVTGRFGYTGQAWLPEIGMYYYKARIYHPDTARGYANGPPVCAKPGRSIRGDWRRP